jgi:cholesterol transport system auxiliary component
MSSTRLLAVVGLSLTLAACVSLGSKPPALLLNLTPAQMVAANQSRSVATGEAISIAVPVAPQALATNRIAVTDGPVAIAYVKDAAWVEPPARLFQRLLSETVAAKTGSAVLDPRQFSIDSGTQVTGQLRAFGMDATTSEAVVIYDAALSRDKGKRIETRRFEARQSVGVIDGRSSGNALNQAANKVADAVAAWVGTLR